MPGSWLNRIFNKPWKAEAALLLCTGLIYLLYFHHILFHLNSVMSSVTLDTIKNYYTFAWHITHDSDLLHFSGMQYPYGEHVVYTDCQPIITFILRPLSFLHHHSIGIMHGLIFLSFIFTPLVLRRIFLALDVQEALAWPAALGLALLSPQFLKMNAGHFALCYTVLIPLSILFIVRYLRFRRPRILFWMVVYNSSLFWLHPYTGFGAAAFTAIALILYSFANPHRRLMMAGAGLLSGGVPVILFKGIMKLTDHHPHRPVEPYGLEVMVENAGSLLTPGFGPFREILAAVFPSPTDHFEGHSYLGIANILLLFALPVLIFFLIRQKRLNGPACTMFIASLVFIPVAFGWHHDVLALLKINSPSVNQFRAVSRFAWFFYYGLGIFVVTLLAAVLRDRRISAAAGGIYLLLCMLEAHAYFRLDADAFWKWNNVLNAGQLTSEEIRVISMIDSLQPQALVPLPVFHGGTEMFDRSGGSNSMLPAFIYSYHSGTPLVSMMASRSSHSESAEVLGLLNTYKKQRPVISSLTNDPLLVIRTSGPLMPDEERLWHQAQPLFRGDSLTFGMIERDQLLQPALHGNTLTITSGQLLRDSVNNVIAIPGGTTAVFRDKDHNEIDAICEIGKNELRPGRYVLSLHYHYTGNTFRALAGNIVLAEHPESGGEWLQYVAVRNLSGHYEGLGVFEWYIDIEKEKRYQVLIHGAANHSYRISDVLIRPADMTVLVSDSSMINNFPRKFPE